MMRNGLCALLLLLAATSLSWAASRAEVRAFQDATQAYRHRLWERAEREFGDFAQKYPDSERRAEAVLLQGQARCQLGQYAGAIQLLSSQQVHAGPWTDQYLRWLGEAHYQTSNYPTAASMFRKLARDFPDSKLRLEASVGEAASWAGLADWDRVAELLSEPGGIFHQLSQSAAGTEVVARGVLLLAEARLAQRAFAAAEDMARRLDAAKLSPQLAWQREFLLCRALLGDRKAEPALLTASNLVALARQIPQPALQAQSLALQAEAFEELGRLENASATYAALNLATNAPAELQRQALFKIGELALVRGRLTESAQTLADFLERHPDSSACDMALLTLGELQLRQYLAAGAGTPTNLASTNLLLAQTNFVHLLERFPRSALAGKAQLNRGWCLVEMTNLVESADAFAKAAQMLPPSYDQAVARFKLADVLYQQGQFAAAITNYQAVVAQSETVPETKTNLCEPALYQIVRASIEITNDAVADAAVGRLKDWFPESYVTESSLLMFGQGRARQGNLVAARGVFENLVRRFPNSPRAAQVCLEIARTYELQRDWPGAMQAYQTWLAKFGGDPERPRAEYALAYASYQAGDNTNALAQFSHFILQYPTNKLAPLAQWWRADYFFRSGDYKNAEMDYQFVFRNWPTNELAYEARMSAGRAAIARQRWSDAIGYFTNLTSDPNVPSNLRTQAMFAFGDALRRSEPAETNNPANLEWAINVFSEIHRSYPTNSAAARAWGEIGTCYFQLAVQNPQHYLAASNAYAQAMQLPPADVATRSQAQIGIGQVQEKLAELRSGNEATALRKLARDNYVDVLYGKNLREGERPDDFWKKEAGLKAAAVSMALGDLPATVNLYREVQNDFPMLRAVTDKKISQAQETLSPPQK